MIGREAEYRDLLERAHRAHLAAGDELAALRCAFWIGVTLASHGEIGGASGWLRRAQRLLDRLGQDRVERGYLLLPAVFEQEAGGDWETAATTAGEAAAIGERFGDSDLFALAAHQQGHILIRLGRLTEGLGLLDEAMVAVTAGELSPIVAGIVYCGVILACQEAHDVGRSREWTAALSNWCARQPDLVAFTGRCLVHRAEIMQLEGAFSDALEEARRAAERGLQGENPAAAGEAYYRQGEIHRVRGDARRGRGGLPGGKPARARAPAGPRPPATRPREGGCGSGDDPQGAGRDRRGREASRVAARLHRDHGGGRRPRGRTRCLSRAGVARGAPRDGHARSAGGTGAGRRRAGRGRRRERAVLASRRERDLAAAQGAVRGGARAGAGGPCLPRVGRRRNGRPRAGCGSRRLRGAGGGI